MIFTKCAIASVVASFLISFQAAYVTPNIQNKISAGIRSTTPHGILYTDFFSHFAHRQALTGTRVKSIRRIFSYPIALVASFLISFQAGASVTDVTPTQYKMSAGTLFTDVLSTLSTHYVVS